MKYFFTASLPSGGIGEAHSAEAVSYKIKQMIDAEDPRKVLSDDDIVAKLRAADIVVARRTVAKYRDNLKIPVLDGPPADEDGAASSRAFESASRVARSAAPLQTVQAVSRSGNQKLATCAAASGRPLSRGRQFEALRRSRECDLPHVVRPALGRLFLPHPAAFSA